jgi:hypothetical protein
MTYMGQIVRRLSVMTLELAAIAAGVGAESARHVRLLDAVTASHDSVALADLLPGDAPAKLRARVSSITVANSPQPGITRMLQRSTLLQKLKSTPDLLQQLEIPDWIVIRRESRELTRDEVFRTIRGTLEQNHFPQALQLTPEAIRMAVPVHVTQANSGLRVLRMNLDPESGTIIFQLWPSQEPKIHPFDVSVILQPGITAWNSAIQPGRSVQFDTMGKEVPQRENHHFATAKTTVRTGHKPDTPPLVTPGQIAVILLQGNDMQVYTYGLPLERGALGDTIRVRSESTGRVFLAQVMAHNSLQAAF